MRSLLIQTDAAVEPKNPGGIGSCAFVVLQKGSVIYDQCGIIGQRPDLNNIEAEYRAVLGALRWSEKFASQDDISLQTDCQLVARQINGEYGCYKPYLYDFLKECKQLIGKLHRCQVSWIPRELNTVADKLTRLAYKESGGSNRVQIFKGLLSK